MPKLNEVVGSSARPRDGRGRVGLDERDPPGVDVGLKEPESSEDGNLSSFILAFISSVPIVFKVELFTGY